MRVPFVRPSMPSAEVVGEAFGDIVASNWYTNFGPQEQRLRRGLEEYVGNGAHVATVANATIALIAALSATLPRGDGQQRIAVASFTFAAGPQAIVWHGYRPAWFDIDVDSMQPSLASFEQLIVAEGSISAILLTNTFGIGNAQIEAWEARADELGIPLIIDSAAGFGSLYANGEPLGARGACEVFSLHATKPFAVGEGGAVVSRDAAITQRIRGFSNFGFENRDIGASLLGMNGKLSEIHAAIGNAQLACIHELLADRRRTLARYMEQLDSDVIAYPDGLEDSSVGFVAMALDSKERRDEVLPALASAGVDAKTYYAPGIHQQPFFAAFQPVVGLGATESLGERMLSLPVLSAMTNEEIDYVCAVVLEHLRMS